jgi:rare lipoprotein A
MRRRTRITRVGCALFMSAVLAGCAGPASQSLPPSPTPSALTPSRSDRGNPPFYDVLGKRYYVLESSDGYRAKGIASWYGGDFHGLSTSSGEPYDMHAMTAAHTTLPLPTWVEVTNLANGKRVIVKVNDRGPFVDDRLIDLSYAAAIELDMIRAGTARVEVRALGASPAVITTKSASARPPNVGATAVPPVIAASSADTAGVAMSERERMYVQVGAFSQRANATKLIEQLRAGGFANSFIVSEDGVGGTLHRVRVGPLRDAAEFDRLSGRLRTLGMADSRLVVDR